MKKRSHPRCFIALLVSCVIILSGKPVLAGDVPDYHKEVLDNGAAVVSCYMPDSPLVTVQLRVLSGLSNEGEYAGTGISHFIEHMIFRGVTEDGVTSVRKAIKAMGGNINGTTGLDSAEYYITVPKEHFTEALKLITAMVMDPVFDEEGIRLERDVILKEMNMIDDEPDRKQVKLLFERAFKRNVYKHPIIGHSELFLELEKSDLERYHSSVYTPERVVLGVAGGVSPEDVFLAAKEYLSEYPRAESWQTYVSPEPRQLIQETVVSGADVELGYIAIGFHSVSLYSEDLYPVNVLSVVLGGGEDSLLHRVLVKEKQLLYSVEAFSINPVYPGLFVVMGTGESENLEKARCCIFEIIEELKRSALKDKDLEMPRNMAVSEYLRSNETTYGVVSSMTSSAIFTGTPDFLKNYVEGIKKVTPIDVSEVAGKYLSENNSTTVYVVPEKVKNSFYGSRKKSSDETKENTDIVETTLKNGLRLVVKKNGFLPLVSVTFAARGGLMAETKDNNGISNLTASLLVKGTAKRRESEIVPSIERMGGVLSPFSGLNSVGLSMDIMSEDLEKGMDIFKDVLVNSVFPEEELEKEKIKIIAEIREQEKDIFTVGMKKIRKLLYKDHPYSMSTIGEINTVEKLDRSGISDFYRRTVSPEGAVICVVGDIDTAKTTEKLSKMFSSWKGKEALINEESPLPPKIWSEEKISMKKQQSLVAIGFRGVTIYDSRKYALDVIGALLSGRDGLLFDSIREDTGLVYTSGSANVPNVDEGYFVLYAATTAENIDKTRDMILGAVDSVIAGEMTDHEIDSSRKRTSADHAISMEGNPPISLTMALNFLYGLGSLHHELYCGEISRVTREDIRNVAGELLDPDLATVVEIKSDL